MKKFLLVPIAFMLFGVSTAFADIIPAGQKAVPACSNFDIASFPKLKLVAQEKNMQGVSTYVYEVKNGDCAAVKGYKFDPVKVYAVDASTTVSANYNPSGDAYAYPTDIAVVTSPVYLPVADSTTYIRYEYKILGVDNSNKKLKIGLGAKETNVLATDYIVAPVAGLDDHINLPSVPFLDVPVTSIYFDAVSYLKAQGVISGYADGTFKPNNPINRAEFTKIIMGSLNDAAGIEACLSNYQTNGGLVVFSDARTTLQNSTPAWYLKYVCYAKNKGFINGYPDGTFKPDNFINFVEAAKILANVFQLGSDAQPNDPWYKVYVDVLAYQKAIPTTILKFAQQITRGEMAEMVYRLKTGNKTKASMSYSQMN
ncbi:MAG: S-layer homology domain-containing protein [Candidatus Gracilibacteria bacterium]